MTIADINAYYLSKLVENYLSPPWLLTSDPSEFNYIAEKLARQDTAAYIKRNANRFNNS